MKENLDLELAKYRLDRARETAEEADTLIREGKLKGAVNRLYFSVFYAARALLATKRLDSAKHSGVIGLFNKEFIKTGIISVNSGKTLSKAFKFRNEGDYQDFREFKHEEIVALRKECSAFIEEVSTYLSSF
ncbi:HEPN domain-containing protein [Desulfofundulus sp. TPOSR]|jgi:uncharacterized protein (UPF0332 family)|uniref:HEPN domain-containing protein n=1 Tax=Desulfofundulus TaxID=2282741 RepID=UPI00054D9348|nr:MULTISPECIES: HEPN domain-containing protein [Desulfofundulus]MDK2888947.1 hypothetical protein [Thermoanaerobacter sp.]NHM27617.1 HEPN domain-containing protein [Desulfofundulus sp. TPOSR]